MKTKRFILLLTFFAMCSTKSFAQFAQRLRTTDTERAVVLLPGDDLTFERNLFLLRAIKQAGGLPAIMQENEGGDG